MDRRTNKDRSGQALPGKKVAALAPSAFRQALTRLSQRLTRNGREFVLALLTILEYEEVKRVLGDQAAAELNNLGLSICARYTRAADRFCNPEPGRFLIVMPDCSVAGAQSATDRLSALIAGSRIHHKHKQLRASCSSQVADYKPHAGDPEAMLWELGYFFDEFSELQSYACGHWAGRKPYQVFGGQLSCWFSRYERLDAPEKRSTNEGLHIEYFRAHDCWSAGKAVQVRSITLSTAFDSAAVELLARRGRALQAIDHPGVLPLLDFHMQDDRQLFLVTEQVCQPDLARFVASEKHLKLEMLADLLLQLCNSLIFLQSVIPPVVPPPLTASNLLVGGDNHLLLVEYELPYLFPALHKSASISDNEMHAVAHGKAVPAYTAVIASFASLFENLLPAGIDGSGLAELLSRVAGTDLPPKLNTIYKIRAAIKEAIELTQQS
jgi:GGDEF domain-containing protein